MPARAQRTVIAISGSGTAQCAAFADALDTLILGAGGTLISQSSLSNVTLNQRQRLYRMPHFDQRRSNPILLMVATDVGLNSVLKLGGYTDFDPNDWAAQATSWPGGIVKSSGVWTVPASWPTNSVPVAPTTNEPDRASNGVYKGVTINFGGGLNAWTIDQLASEYGVFWFADDGTGTRVCGRQTPMSTQHMGRDIAVYGTIGFSAAPGPIAAPVGVEGCHLRFECDGAVIQVTFPTGAVVDADLFAQYINMQSYDVGVAPKGAGYIEATRHDLMGGFEQIKVRIPTGRAPSGFYAAEMRSEPRLALTFQDDSVAAAGLDFRRYFNTGAVVAVYGAYSTIQFAVNNLPIDYKIRAGGVDFTAPTPAPISGSTIYNKTQNQSATIQAFLATGGIYDTAVLNYDVVAAGWTNGDVYEIYPGPEGQLEGSGSYGGIAQIVDATDAAVHITAGPDVEVALDDIYGECHDHFEVGQLVPIHNNGCAVILTVPATTNFVVGEPVRLATAGDSVGMLRGKNATQLIVDTIRGRVATNASKGPPWVATLTIESAGLGTGSEVISAVASSTGQGTMGWGGLVEIVAKDRVNSIGGDWRTKLTLKTSDVLVNPALDLMPGAVIGLMSKVALQLSSSGGYVSATGGVVALVPGYYGGDGNVAGSNDVRRNEGVLGNYTPARTPNTETGALENSEVVLRINEAGGYVGAPFMGELSHIRMITSTGAPISPGDILDEDQDPNRKWRVAERETVFPLSGTFWGAQTQIPARVGFYTIGPGAIP